MTITVISQSMYLPWLGLFEQMKFADLFVHYDDVQFSRGFYNRVQIMGKSGSKYITIPLKKGPQKQLLQDKKIDNQYDWKLAHRNSLTDSLKSTPFFKDAIKLFERTTAASSGELVYYSRGSIKRISEYMGINEDLRFEDSASLNPVGISSQRLLDICKKTGTEIYLTGLGGLNYLDHELFERNNVDVFYMNYRFIHYNRLRNKYTPYLSSLDPIAHLGPQTVNTMRSKMIHWSEAIKNPADLRATQYLGAVI